MGLYCIVLYSRDSARRQEFSLRIAWCYRVYRVIWRHRSSVAKYLVAMVQSVDLSDRTLPPIFDTSCSLCGSKQQKTKSVPFGASRLTRRRCDLRSPEPWLSLESR